MTADLAHSPLVPRPRRLRRTSSCAALFLLLTTCDGGPTDPTGPTPPLIDTDSPEAAIGGPYAGEEGSPVAFEGGGTSERAPLSYAWSFGDGATGSGRSPSHTYADDGTYTVVLRVTDGTGLTSAPDTAKVTIANVPPSVSLTLDRSSALLGEAVSATGSFADPGVLDAPWAWELDWGDGTTDSGSAETQSAAITGDRAYAAPGAYTVRLTVTDKDGGIGTAERTVNVAAPPEADAGGPYGGEEGSPVAFDGSGSSGTGTLSYAWSFGDGGTASGQKPAHTYADDGKYTVVLTVTDGSGVSSKPDTTTVTIANAAPSVSLSLDRSSALVGQSVTASGSFTDPGLHDGPWQWELDWGDGTRQTGSASSASSTISRSRAYAAPGTYTVRLTVTDKDGGTGTAQRTVSVAAPPEADAGGPYTGQEGSPVAFDGSGSSGTGPLSYAWSFGDESSGAGQKPSHTYADNGTYTVVLRVTDATGLASAPDTAVVTIANVPPSVSLTLGRSSALVGESVAASGSFTDPGAKDAPWQWELDWGDGNRQTGSASSVSAAISGSRAYSAPGTYTVRLRVTDKDGGTGTAERTVSVAAPPQADAGGPYTGQEGAPVAFSGSGSSGTGPLSYSWSFGDGGGASGQKPTHTYADNGTYTVVLTVTDASGVSSKPDTTTVAVANVAPSVSLSLSRSSTLVGESVTASGAFSDPGEEDAPWEWELDWGDGTKQTGSASGLPASISRSRAYAAPGAYTVRLTVTDKDGGTGTAQRTVSVAAPPVADAGGPYTGQEGSPVAFDGSGSSGTGALSYAWSFGDGSTGSRQKPTQSYADDGTYTVVLTVTDESGVAGKPDTTTVTIANVAPTVSLSVDRSSALIGQSVTASGSFTDPGLNDGPWQWELDWGDGTKQTGSAPSVPATISRSRAYAAPGTYTVRLTVTDKDAGMGSAQRTVTVTAPPEADAGGPYSGQEGSPVAFDGSGSSGAGTLSYAWSFGDGGTATGQKPTYTYADNGTYTVVLTVTSASGVAGKPDTTTATISNVAPSVSLSVSTSNASVGQSVTASGSYTDAGALDWPWQWELDWGDGTVQTGTGSSPAGSISRTRAYSAPGTYTVRLRVTDKDGGTGTAQATVSVSSSGPSADFSFATDNLEVTFSDASSSPSGAITSWNWTFGDGTVATVRNPIRTYAAPGTYTARLTVTDMTGATASRQRTVTVSGVGTSKTMLIGAGDIAGCGIDNTGHPYQDAATAAILDRFPNATVFTAGDNVYPDATWTEHMECYDPTWGRHRSRTRPSAGNHEYHTPNAQAYFEYFGSAAGDPSRGYYSYTRGSWLILALNTNIPMHAGSQQEQWLRATLTASPNQCKLAYFHHPRFSTGRGDNADADVTALWNALWDHRTDLVIASHDHVYERFAPRDRNGAIDLDRGVRQITVGTGGGRLYPFGWPPSPATEVRNNTTHGVLKVVLESNAYTWEFIPVQGGSFTDSGRRNCH